MKSDRSSPYSIYWEAYGGFSALLSSRYFWFAVISLFPAYRLWESKAWAALALTVMPNLLGFTLAGYAILLSFGGERFLLALAGRPPIANKNHSQFVVFNASYTHFVLFQTATLIFSLVINSSQRKTLEWPLNIINEVVGRFGYSVYIDYICVSIVYLINFSGCLLFFYTIYLLLPTVMNVFRLAVNFDRRQRKILDQDARKNKLEKERKEKGYARRKILAVRRLRGL